MTGIPLVIAEPTGRYRRALRRFTFSAAATGQDCPAAPRLGHDASTDLGEVTEAWHIEVIGDTWPHDDPRWPAACQACGQEFSPGAEWQLRDSAVYRMPDGTEFTWRGAFGQAAPPGAMIRATWYDEYSQHPDGIESWLIALPDGGEWTTSQRASGGGYWTVTGVAPNLTASPSIFHNAPTGWHGWVREGHLVGA